MSKAFQVKIVTPQRVEFEGAATRVTCPGTKGGFQVLYNHAPLLSSLEIGVLKVLLEDGTAITYSISGGFAQVRSNVLLVLADSAERADRIDIDRAKAAADRAKDRLANKDGSLDVFRAQVSLQRAINRLRAANLT